MKPANTLVTRCLTLLLISIIVSALSLPGAANALAGPPADPGDGIVVTLETPPYQLSIDANGFDVVHIDGFAPFGTPGEPTLPRKVYNVALPPDAALDSLSLEITGIQTIAVPGTYRLRPATPDMTSGSAQEDAARYRPSSQPVANADAADLIRLFPPGQMRKWRFARLEYSPVQYDVTTGQLSLVTQVTVGISFDQSQGAEDTTLLADDVFDDVAQDTFVNYDTAQAWYRELGGQDQPSIVYDYVIITTNATETGSSKLAAFKTHKQSQGFSVLIITQDEYGGLTGQPPNGTAERIRKWLQNNYSIYAIEYVLLIGDPDPDDPTSGGDSVGDVPMKMCWPRCTTSSSDAADCVSPTDHFYADLTGNWNYNANIYFGEWGGDYGPAGGVDFANEVTVGRIPVYGGNYATLDLILQKIIDYEIEPDPSSWRRSALLPMSFSTKTYDGAPLAQQMIDDYLALGGYSHWTQYQQGNGACGLNSPYASNQELRGGTVVRDRWAANDYGLVLWWGHGSGTSASVGCEGCWDGPLFNSSYASSLDDDHPSFVYLNSCLNGYPENTGNLQYSLLRQGAIGTVGATRVSWFNDGVGYGQFDGSTTNSGIGYEYARRLVRGQAAGDALYNTKTSMTPEQSSRLMNFYDFNLYGDPSTAMVAASEIYLPVVLRRPPGPSGGPTPGFWADPPTGDEFYVSTDRANVVNFAIRVDIKGCGRYKITHTTSEPITNNQFSFSGAFYASGTFNSDTSASGTLGLNGFTIPGCGTFSYGPAPWNVTWQNSSQPSSLRVEAVEPESGRPGTAAGEYHMLTPE